MALAVILVLMYMVVFTQARGCLPDQHCQDCNWTTRYCETKCNRGYYGLKCKIRCKENCLNNKCESTGTGIGRCTEGCVPGYYGTDCRRSCERQHVMCTKCQSGCDQGYCQLESYCVDGCVDDYYGSDCMNCSSGCKTCNRITGTCEECYPLYTGPDCHYSGLCEAGCMEGCERQISGHFCVEVCSGHCRLKPNINDTTKCLAPGVNASVICTSECHNQSGECLHGCVDGWYGPRCSSPCSAGCRGGRCDDAGACVDECIARYSGEFCNDTCEMCRGGICDQKTGTCINGCEVSKHGCEASCTSNCSLKYCSGETCTDSRTNGIGIGTACAFFVLGILVSTFVWYCKKRSANRHNLADVEQSLALDYQSQHSYYDIVELDAEQPTENQEHLEEELGLAMPIIADVFPAAVAIVHRDDEMSSESSASYTYESYTHLDHGDPGAVDSYISPVEELTLHPPDPDVVTDDPGAVDSYISPVEELTLHSSGPLRSQGCPVDRYFSPMEDVHISVV